MAILAIEHHIEPVVVGKSDLSGARRHHGGIDGVVVHGVVPVAGSEGQAHRHRGGLGIRGAKGGIAIGE